MNIYALKKLVDTYGSENIPGKNYSIAFVELIKLIGIQLNNNILIIGEKRVFSYIM